MTIVPVKVPLLSTSNVPTKVPSSPSKNTSTSVTQSLLASRILYLGQQLESAWSVDMVESNVGTHLTVYGEDYFTNVIPNLRDIAPAAFSGQVINPTIETKLPTTAYADTLEHEVDNTPFDFTSLAGWIHLSRGMVTGILYYTVVTVFIIAISVKLKTYKGTMLLLIPCVIGGAFMGVPLLVTVMAGFGALVLIWLTMFYGKSSET